MADYDRRILVPYLWDVCSAEMLCSKTARELSECRRTIDEMHSQIDQKISMPVPPAPDPFHYRNIDEEDRIQVFSVFAIGLFAVGFLTFLFTGMEGIWVELPILAISALNGYLALSEKKRTDHNRWARYQSNVESYEENVKRYESMVRHQNELRRQLPQWTQYEHGLAARLRQEEKLREHIYSVNVIPARYRNIYAAYYLYDYFRTSGETDLDRIIQTLLLDEIKQRLDQIIVQNEEIMLNQRIQIALQEQQDREATENHRQEMKRLASMERNQELQMDYQRMIEQNQEVTNFFLAADYLRQR